MKIHTLPSIHTVFSVYLTGQFKNFIAIKYACTISVNSTHFRNCYVVGVTRNK